MRPACDRPPCSRGRRPGPGLSVPLVARRCARRGSSGWRARVRRSRRDRPGRRVRLVRAPRPADTTSSLCWLRRRVRSVTRRRAGFRRPVTVIVASIVPLLRLSFTTRSPTGDPAPRVGQRAGCSAAHVCAMRVGIGIAPRPARRFGGTADCRRPAAGVGTRSRCRGCGSRTRAAARHVGGSPGCLRRRDQLPRLRLGTELAAVPGSARPRAFRGARLNLYRLSCGVEPRRVIAPAPAATVERSPLADAPIAERDRCRRRPPSVSRAAESAGVRITAAGRRRQRE